MLFRNNMKRLIYIYIFVFINMFASCQKEIEIELPDQEPKIVANCLFRNDSLFSVHISNSIGTTSSDKIKDINNAVCDIYENGILKETLTFLNDGIYNTNTLTAKAGKEYQLKISVPGMKEVVSVTQIPNNVMIDTAWYTSGQEGQLYLSFNDPQEKNFYALSFYQLYTDTFTQTTYATPLYIGPKDDESIGNQNNDGLYLNDAFYFNDELFNGKNYSLNLSFNSVNAYDTSTVYLAEFRTLSKDFYEYERTLSLQQSNNGNPFSEPVRVHTNISGGFGIFAGYSGFQKIIRRKP